MNVCQLDCVAKKVTIKTNDDDKLHFHNDVFYYTARVQYEDRFPWYSQISPLIPVSELGNRILIATVMAYGQTAVSIYRQICKFDFFRVFIET